MKFNHSYTITMILFLALISSFSANAQIITCSTDSVTLDHISVIGDVNEENLLADEYNSTACLGTYDGQDFLADGFLLDYTVNNIGELGDGLLNGQNSFFNGMEFIEAADLQDLDGDGDATDPGWIHLGDVWQNWGKGFTTHYDEIGTNESITLAVNDLLTLEFGCGKYNKLFFGKRTCENGTGYWELTTKLDVVESVQSLLGGATFDHLAFSINSALDFAVYDFDFTEIFAAENNDELNFLTPYKIGGTFNMDDFPLGSGTFQPLHINVWARDPAISEVSEPSTLALAGLGLMAALYRRRKMAYEHN